jgi:hypothetical protein
METGRRSIGMICSCAYRKLGPKRKGDGAPRALDYHDLPDVMVGASLSKGREFVGGCGNPRIRVEFENFAQIAFAEHDDVIDALNRAHGRRLWRSAAQPIRPSDGM